MRNLWKANDKSMTKRWWFYNKSDKSDKSIINLWDIYEKSVRNLWEIYIKSMKNLQKNLQKIYIENNWWTTFV